MAFILMVGLTFGQTLQKGAVVAVGSYDIVLNPDVTMKQFLDFYTTKYIPEFEKSFSGIKAYLISGDRGEKKNQIGEIWLFESVALRNKYFPVENDTTMNEAVKVATAKMKTMDAEAGKYVKSWNRVYTDWIIK